jgi:hypothetical protein
MSPEFQAYADKAVYVRVSAADLKLEGFGARMVRELKIEKIRAQPLASRRAAGMENSIPVAAKTCSAAGIHAGSKLGTSDARLAMSAT